MSDLFEAQKGALWLANSLRQHRVEVAGIDAGQIRAAIIDAGVEVVIAGRHPSGKGCETYEAAFARVFGEPLVAKKKRGKKQC